ncbi:MAG: ABC transporter substrate-binding protein [Candidatus Bathyarchaeota archaeon]|nr:ABC transporter substrate-binding protein [Candidatus Bathyarchaeota archaeon]
MSRIINTKNKKIFLGALLLVVIISATYGAYSLFFTTETEDPETEDPETEDPETEDPTPENTTIVITDVQGVEVNVTLPVNKLVTLTGGVTEIVYALGAGDKLVGRDSYSTFPNATSEVPVVSESSGGLNMELLAEVEPDLIIADVRIDNETRAEIEEVLGIPVIIDNPSQSDRVEPLITYLGTMLDAEETASELLEFINHYLDLVNERVSTISDSEKPLVYYEWVREWFSCSSVSLPHQMLTDAGGLNLAADEESTYPTLSPEHVLEQNPDVVIRVMTSTTHNVTEFEAMRATLMNRTGLVETTAVETGAVFVMDGAFRTGIRNHLGLLTLAKCFHPDLFEDIDITEVHTALLEIFFGVVPEGVYYYPEEQTPKEEPVPEFVIIEDVSGASINITLPVERIVVLNDGLAGVICALGGEDKIVGRPNGYEGYPRSLLEKPNAGDSLTPNLEVILELEPDLVVTDTALYGSEEVLETLADAGIPMIMEDSGVPDRIATIVNNFGSVLENTKRATEINNIIQNYRDLIQERLQDIPVNERERFFLGFMDYGWLTMTNGSVANDRLVECGGINIAANSTVMYPTLSPEYIIESNPDVIIVMAYGGSNLETHQYARNQFLDNPVLSEVQAIKDNRVYTYNDCIGTGVQYPVGLLYFAKWFYPSVFADIDPSAVHQELIQELYGEEVDGVYAYPKIATVIDGLGNEVTLTQPVERIVTLDPGLTEIICVLGCENKLVGRDSAGGMIVLPSSVEDVPVVEYNVELILELEPDLIISGAALDYYTEKREQIEAAGIPLFITGSANPQPSAFSNVTAVDTSCELVTTIGKLIGADDTAAEYVDYVQHYNDLVKDRIANLSREEKPTVLLEWYQPYQTSVINYQHCAGAINIAENQTFFYTVLSAEFVISQNPDIIICAISSPEHDEADFIAMRNEILNRPELSEVKAVQNEQVYVYDYVVLREGIGAHEVIGYLYWAKWCQPELFEDIDPAAVNSEFNQIFFGTDPQGVFVYP